MDNDIGALFKEKNDKILYEKLLLDISNNDNSLRLIVVNKINLISLKFQKRINDFFKLNSIDYDLDSIEKNISEYKEKILDLVNKYLDERKSKLEQSLSITSGDKSEENNEPNKKEIFTDFAKLFNEVIYIEMANSIFSTYKFSDEELKDIFIIKYLKKFDFDLSNSLVECIVERNQVLKNMISDTSKKVQSLNDMTSKKYMVQKQ